MQKTQVILGVLVLGILFFGCTNQTVPVCNSPYILVGTNCCLDQNNNKICDSDETAIKTNETGCSHNNPSCEANYDCINNGCVLKSGCQYSNPACNSNQDCLDNKCVSKKGCQYNNSPCEKGYDCIGNQCVLKAINFTEACNQSTDIEHMDIFDAHAHEPHTVSAALMISEMNAGGVSMANLYTDASASLRAISQYPGRFVTFVDTPESPEPTTWVNEGETFVRSAEDQLKTGKYSGIGETDLRLSGMNILTGEYVSTPAISVPADNPIWLELVDLSAKYHVPISFHFVPEDAVANEAFERMLNHNKDATLLWCHLGFNSMTLNRTALNEYLLRYPHLYFDTAGIQSMQRPLPEFNSNWWLLTNQSNDGKLNDEWKQFFETWNSRILFGTDAGGGEGLPRWLNYVNQTSNEVPPDAIGHWRHLFGNLEYNSARNILNGNARTLFLKEQKPLYDYSVSSDGRCYHILVSSASSVSALTFDQRAKVITFTVAESTGTAWSAAITIPTALGGNFTAKVDGQSIQIKETSNSTHTTLTLGYAGGIRTVAISVPQAD